MASKRRELRRQLHWLMTLRVVVTTTLLGCVFVIELLYRPLLPLDPFYLLAICTYLLTILYAIFMRSPRAGAWQAYLQLIGDVAIVTGFVYLTGGASSPFSFLYLPPIIVGCILLMRGGGFLVAGWSWLMYATLVLLIHNEVLPRYPEMAFQSEESATVRILYSLLAHLVSFVALAYLASHLTEGLKRAGQELELRRDDLAHLRAFNENIIDSINSGLLTTDGDGQITFANRAATAIMGCAEPDLRGRNIADVLGREKPFFWEIRTSLEREKRHRFEIEYIDGQGRELYLGFTVSILKERSGAALGMILIFQDLTEIRALEEEIGLKKRMAALGEMAAGVAHELRNPLASISGSVQVLKRDLRAEDEAVELLDIVIKESRRLDGIIRDFLLFAKPGRFQPGETDLGALIRETLSLLENSTEKRAHHRVLMEVPGERIPAVLDVDRMKQVFWNLTRNSLRAMPSGGTLSVKAGRGQDGGAVITFSDTGIGMSEREVAENFQPFHGSFQGGTGLGLAIVYRIVEEHGGRIKVQSRPGAGTQVTIHLPHRAAGGELMEARRWTAS